jgi:hypothetical protein
MKIEFKKKDFFLEMTVIIIISSLLVFNVFISMYLSYSLFLKLDNKTEEIDESDWRGKTGMDVAEIEAVNNFFQEREDKYQESLSLQFNDVFLEEQIEQNERGENLEESEGEEVEEEED